MTDWKPGDLCQVKRGRRWVDAEVFLTVPNNKRVCCHRVAFGNGRGAWVGDDDIRPRPAKRGKLPDPKPGSGAWTLANFPALSKETSEALLGQFEDDEPTAAPTLTTPAAPILRPVPKHKTARNKNYLAHVRTFPCCSCGTTEAIHAHHVASGGMGAKASDYLTAPLCGPCHSHWHATATLPALSEGGALLVAMSRSVLWMAAAKCLAAWVERER